MTPHDAAIIAKDLKWVLDAEAEHFKPGRQHHNGPRRVELTLDVHRGMRLLTFLEALATGGEATWKAE